MQPLCQDATFPWRPATARKRDGWPSMKKVSLSQYRVEILFLLRATNLKQLVLRTKSSQEASLISVQLATHPQILA